MTGRELAMFPLGTVLFPSLVLPLHVFEERYRAMVRHLLGGDVEPELGVVLIERGSEVGGNDVRTDVGTVAQIVEAREFPDGRFALTTLGTRRLRVREWLPDDPWPRAVVEDLDDEPLGDTAAAAERWEEVQGLLRRVLGLAAELGEASVPATVELSDDATLGSFQAAAVSPLGPVDQQAVLATTSLGERLELLARLLAEAGELLEARLRLGSGW
jgi:Lon protease-like protein